MSSLTTLPVFDVFADAKLKCVQCWHNGSAASTPVSPFNVGFKNEASSRDSLDRMSMARIGGNIKSTLRGGTGGREAAIYLCQDCTVRWQQPSNHSYSTKNEYARSSALGAGAWVFELWRKGRGETDRARSRTKPATWASFNCPA